MALDEDIQKKGFENALDLSWKKKLLKINVQGLFEIITIYIKDKIGNLDQLATNKVKAMEVIFREEKGNWAIHILQRIVEVIKKVQARGLKIYNISTTRFGPSSPICPSARTCSCSELNSSKLLTQKKKKESSKIANEDVE